jgi:hypothetical protein
VVRNLNEFPPIVDNPENQFWLVVKWTGLLGLLGLTGLTGLARVAWEQESRRHPQRERGGD